MVLTIARDSLGTFPRGVIELDWLTTADKVLGLILGAITLLGVVGSCFVLRHRLIMLERKFGEIEPYKNSHIELKTMVTERLTSQAGSLDEIKQAVDKMALRELEDARKNR